MAALDGTDAALLEALDRHPAHGAVVAHAVREADGGISDFVVERTTETALRLLGPDLHPGVPISRLAGGRGSELLPELSRLVTQGGWAQHRLAPGGDLDELVPVDLIGVGDRVICLLDPGATRQLALQERGFRALVESAVDVIQVLEPTGTVRYTSPGAQAVLGYPPERLLGGHFRAMVDLRDRRLLEEAFARVLTAPPGEVVEAEFRVLRHGENDEVRWIHGRGSNHLQTPGVNAIVVNWRDVTVPLELRSRLEYAATHDALTGLANRTLFIDHLELALAAAARHAGSRVAVLFCDLDRFKMVNDSLGHAAGDALLRQVGRRLHEAVRPGDTVARLGGDEFAVLCPELVDDAQAHLLAERIMAALEGPYRLDEAPQDLLVGTSVGVASSAYPPQSAEQLLREADTALYEAKRQGRNRVELFSGRLSDSLTGRLRLETDLRRALENGQLVLQYQPKLDLHENKVFSAEALLRWDHPERGLLLPSAFLPLAEEAGLLAPIGEWVLRTATAQVAAWMRSGLGLAVQINFSDQELNDPGMLPLIEETLTTCAVDAAKLEVEITERAAAADLARTIETVRTVRARGSHVALDDFGTGYCSLTWLQQIPVDTVKLDQTFILRLGEHSPSTAIVESVLRLSAALGLITVAEGVETAAQLEQLRTLGCDAAQGFFIGRPMWAADLEKAVV
jgi:diguanylate cyclase (GGDEF)-like protein/PAS domain S-box-containing protein